MTRDPQSIIEGFLHTRRAVLEAALTVPAELRDVPFVGKWDLKALLAHLIGWDYTNVTAIDDLMAGRLPDFFERYDPGWARENDRLVATYGTGDWDGLMGALRRSEDAVAGKLRSLPPGALTAPGPVWRTRPITIAGIFTAAIRDEDEHARQIRDFAAAEGAGRSASLDP